MMNNKPDFEVKVGLKGHFILEKFKGDADGNPVGDCIERLEFDNVITNGGLDLIYNCPTYAYGIGYFMNSCAVGTGNTAPAVTDTSLANYLTATGRADASTTNTYVAGPPAYWKAVQTYQFGTGVAAGNLTEIGIFPTNGSATNLFSRALIVDGSGNPTVIVVESDEVLNVTYELDVYFNTSDVTGTFVSGGITYNTVIRPATINLPNSISRRLAPTSDGSTFTMAAYSGALGTITQTPGGTGYSIIYYNGAAEGPYVNGDHHIDVRAVAPVNSANFGAGGVKAFLFGSGLGFFQISFLDGSGNGIPKVSGQQMSCTFRYSWDRYAP